MKRKVLLGAILWTLLITLGHVQLNVGWARLADEMRILVGGERQELVVGFLPVT
ncbi:hypothetical protein Pla163_37680 [Planctomycetes bacterium Pla163]|uniref:Uncharacterized protein n=1 Tax=Rohdeia mirabilis TaxID=2528008 RepID=A0A518D571_9BACT|nr:hypothetical protein Pla163_37680 [Planctomycetes bacterium Pla163]